MNCNTNHWQRAKQVLAGSVALALLFHGSPTRADFTWTGDCNEYWHACCTIDIDGELYNQNNWDVGMTPWPDCPPLPGPADDVVIGSDLVILSGITSINSLSQAGGGTFRLEIPYSAWLDFAGTLTFDGYLIWRSGTLRGAGEIFANGDILINAWGGVNLDQATLHNTGTVTWENMNIGLFNDAVIDNQGVWLDALTNNFSVGGPFNNAGSYIKTTAFVTSIYPPFNNSGSVDIQAGALRLVGAAVSPTGVSTGSFQIASGASVEFWTDYVNTYVLDQGTTISGAGEAIAYYSVSIADGATVPVDRFAIPTSSSRLLGLGTLTIADQLRFTGGGNMRDAGTTVIEPGAVWYINGGWVFERTIDNYGSAIWTDYIYLKNGATLNNRPGAVFDIQNDGIIGGDDGAINNGGLFVKSAGSGTTFVSYFPGVVFNNTGTVEVRTGTLRFEGPYTQTAGSTILNGGQLKFNTYNSALDMHGGVLTGAGVVDGHVNNTGGSVAPGFSAGVIQITGDYTQGASATLDIELAGLTQGTEYDLLTVDGDASLAGTLAVELAGGFEPTAGDEFVILTADSVTGTFSQVELIDFPAGLELEVSYGSDAVTLTVASATVGDLNCDGAIDAFDIDPFVLALTDPAGYEAAYPDCDIMLADINGDGAVDAFDIDPFVALLVGG